ncbi:DUF6518 family protein [Streptomyces hawaiiensis]|uniref:DUF6518 family protein n=1 Tax=Streptomyces hawaiiensis TaxID=67305 RepID=UPI003646B244
MGLTNIADHGSRSHGSVRSLLFTHTSILAVGAIFGACGPLLTSTGGQVGHAIHLILSAGWSWAALAFFAGMSGASKLRSAITGATALLSAVLTYYLTKAGQGEYLAADLSDPSGQTTHFDWGGFLVKIFVWCFFACLLGPLLGVAGNLSRNGPYRLPCQLLVPFVAIMETSMRLRNEAAMQGPFVTTMWSATRVVAVVAAATLVSLSALGIWRRRSADRTRN